MRGFCALLIAVHLLPSLVIASDPLCESANQSPLYDQLIPAVVSLGSNESAVGGSGVLIGRKHVLSSKHGNINIDRIYVRNVYNQVVHGRVIGSKGLWVDKGCRAVFRDTNAQDDGHMRAKVRLNLLKGSGECKSDL
jgi:hypothetical protein